MIQINEFKNTDRRSSYPVDLNHQHLDKEKKEEYSLRHSFQICLPQSLESHFQDVQGKEKQYLSSVFSYPLTLPFKTAQIYSVNSSEGQKFERGLIKLKSRWQRATFLLEDSWVESVSLPLPASRGPHTPWPMASFSVFKLHHSSLYIHCHSSFF